MRRSAPWWRSVGWLALLLSLTGVQACATGAGRSPFQVSVPTLQASPVHGTCMLNGRPANCTLLLTADFEALVRNLKAACLANGQSREQCQADDAQ